MFSLIKMLKVQAHAHRRKGDNSLGDLFENAQFEIEDMKKQLAKANERVKELEVQLKRLIDYEADQALLPEASSQGTRQLVNDIKNDATDVGGCYEVSCGLLDSLFEHYTDKGTSKLLNKFAIEKKIEGAFSFADYLDKSNFSAAIAAKESGFFQLVETFGKQLQKEQQND